MSTRAQTTLPFGARRPTVVLPPDVREELRTLVARLLLVAIRKQQKEEGNDEKRK